MERKKPFWATVPGILTGIAAVLAALVPLIYALKGTTPPSKLTYPQTTGTTTAQPVPQQPTTATTPSIPQVTQEQKSDFQKLGARFLGIKFYLGEHEPTSFEKRVFSERFELSQARSRFIWWNLRMAFPETSESLKFNIESIWYDPYGEVIYDGFIKYKIQTGSTSALPGGGYLVTDQWKPGVYRVVIKVDDKEVSSGLFTLVGPSGQH